MNIYLSDRTLHTVSIQTMFASTMVLKHHNLIRSVRRLTYMNLDFLK